MDRQGVLATLENMRLRTLGIGEFAEWAIAQLRGFQFLSEEETLCASLDQIERLAREARRQRRRQRRKGKRAAVRDPST